MRVAVLWGALSMAFTGPAWAQKYDQSVQVETQAETIRGDVVRYVPSRLIVVRIDDGREVSYRLSPGLRVPANVQAGQRITLLTDRSADGSPTIVRRVSTSSGKPVSGRVEAYSAGKSITLLRADGIRTTYALNPLSQVPGDPLLGKRITIVPVDAREAVVQTITIREP
jgi:hypothetical protein